MKRVKEGVVSKQLCKDIWISCVLLYDEDGKQGDFQFDRDFVHAFGSTEKEAKQRLETLLQQRGDVAPTEFEAHF